MNARRLMSLVVAAGLLSVPGVASASPIYNPVGPQQNVSIASVIAGGWSLCYSGGYGESGLSISGITAGCTGDQMMLAGGLNGTGELLLLAQAAETDVMFTTAVNAVHNANGADWYFNSLSWGFAPQGFGISQNSADTNSAPGFGSVGDDGTNRLSWHTGEADNLAGGWRVGNATFLNSEPSGYTRYIFTSTGDTPAAVPEPASLLLLSSGLAFASRRLRRRKS